MKESIESQQAKNFYSSLLCDHFSHLEPQEIIGAMARVQNALVNEKTVRELATELGEAMLIVPGTNQIGNEQLTVLMENYRLNQAYWENLIEEFGQNHG